MSWRPCWGLFFFCSWQSVKSHTFPRGERCYCTSDHIHPVVNCSTNILLTIGEETGRCCISLLKDRIRGRERKRERERDLRVTGWACPAHFGQGRWCNWKVITPWVACEEAQYHVTESPVCGSAVSA